MDLSVIIVSYNVKGFVIRCLKSVLSNADSQKIEVFVVDNASEDGTVEEVRRQFPSVRVISNKKNVGFPKANNQAMAISSGRLILLLNPDTVVHPGAISELVAFLGRQKNGAIAGMNVLNDDGSRQHSTRDVPSAKELFFASVNFPEFFSKKNRTPRAQESIGIEWGRVIRVGCVSGAAMAFNRVLFDQIGGLDENLFWIEDVDFCYRSYHAGFPVYFLPDAMVTHFVGKSGASNFCRVVFHQHVSKIKFFEKHYGWTAARVLEALFFIELLGKVLIRLFQCLKASKRKESRDRISGYIAALDFIVRKRMPVWT